MGNLTTKVKLYDLIGNYFGNGLQLEKTEYNNSFYNVRTCFYYYIRHFSISKSEIIGSDIYLKQLIVECENVTGGLDNNAKEDFKCFTSGGRILG